MSAQTYIDELNAKAREWAAENDGRVVGTLRDALADEVTGLTALYEQARRNRD